MLAERVLLPAEGTAKVPAHLSDEEAATLPCAALTAWTALFEEGRVKAGETVLVLGTGGVSLFALQLAKLAGARVILTSSSEEKLARAKALGADELIHYPSDPSWGDSVRRLTGDGVDHVVEVGGAGTLAQSLKATRVGGTVHLIGVLSGAVNDLNLVPLFMGHRRLQGVFVGHKDAFGALTAAVETHRLRPVIDRVFSFEDAPAAFLAMKSERHFGKLCIRVSGAPT
jgi:NADPH:quinone reductase-like Zn-dependent oxidoreductase